MLKPSRGSVPHEGKASPKPSTRLNRATRSRLRITPDTAFMKTIANRKPAMPSNTVAYSFDARATFERRVFPLMVTLALWVVVIEAARLAL